MFVLLFLRAVLGFIPAQHVLFFLTGKGKGGFGPPDPPWEKYKEDSDDA